MDPMHMWSMNYETGPLDGQLQQGGNASNMGNMFMDGAAPQAPSMM